MEKMKQKLNTPQLFNRFRSNISCSAYKRNIFINFPYTFSKQSPETEIIIKCLVIISNTAITVSAQG